MPLNISLAPSSKTSLATPSRITGQLIDIAEHKPMFAIEFAATIVGTRIILISVDA